jgi:hypothetical protein
MIGSMLVLLCLSQGPAQPARTGTALPSLSAQRQAELKKLNEARKARRAQAGAARAKALGLRRPRSGAGQPGAADLAAQQALLQQNQVLAQQNQALQGIADAAQQQAAVAADQFRLNSQMAGVPQIFVPGQGMVPYPYGIAAPAYQYPNAGTRAPTAPLLPLQPAGR